MRRFILPLAIVLLAAGAWAAEPDDVQFHRMLQRTAAAAKKLEFTQMLGQILQRGANMGPGSGWFKPSESRYDWKWLSARHGGKERIAAKEFTGPPELFARLDRNRDGGITESDLDFSDSSPYWRQMSTAQMWLRVRGQEGKLSKAHWDELFKQLARGKEYLDADDVRGLIFPPPPPPSPPRKPGPGEGPPSKAVLLQGLFNGEIGSMSEGPKLGQKAPDFTLPSHDGKKFITLSKFGQDKPVVLIFGSFT